MSERQQYAPISVQAPWSKTTTRLHEKFGWTGVLAWHFLLLAAKRSRTPGRIAYLSEIEFWSELGMAADLPAFTATEFLDVLSRMKQIKRSDARRSRVRTIEITQFGRWNQTDRRFAEAERKRLGREGQNEGRTRAQRAHNARTTRAEDAQDARTTPANDGNPGRTSFGHDPDASAPLSTKEVQVLKDFKNQTPVARGKAELPSDVTKAMP